MPVAAVGIGVMSGKISGLIWDLDLPHVESYILLAMADHADHEGYNVFPSIGLIAWKTNYSERQVQRSIKSLCEQKILVPMERAAGKVVRYRIDVSAAPLKAPRVVKQIPDRGTPDPRVNGQDPRHHVTPDKVSPLTPRHPIPLTPRHPRQDVTGDIAMSYPSDIAMSPEPLLNRQKKEKRRKEEEEEDDMDERIKQLFVDNGLGDRYE